MATESASLCLGIMSCECVDVMYSTGMRTHMAVITQTHTQAAMQQEYRVCRNWEFWTRLQSSDEGTDWLVSFLI